MFNKLILFCASSLLLSCSLSRQMVQLPIDNTHCSQENRMAYTKADIPAPLHSLNLDTLLSNRFSAKDLNIANAIGLLPLLKEWAQLQNSLSLQPSLNQQVALLQLQQQMNTRLDLASLEISAVSAELDCEEEKIRQVAAYLSDKEKKAETRLTVASIIMGSASAIVTGILLSGNDKSNVSDGIGVGVGIADAALGIGILTNQKKVALQHPRNVLRELWLATETSSVYPPSIWYYLNHPAPGNTDGASLRAQLIANWKKFDQVNASASKKQEKNLDIYFSDGGTYTTEQLENRAGMYDQIESTIKLMKQDLRNLTLSISRGKSQ